MEPERSPGSAIEKPWPRVAFMALFVLVLHVLELVLGAIVLVQFLVHLFTGKPLPELRRLGQALASYVQEVLGYLTYAHDEKPFPFARWPHDARVRTDP